MRALDGEIGKVHGIVIDPSDHNVTHVLHQEGQLWGREDVAIPVSAVIDFDSNIRLNISKQNVRGLPALDIAHADELPLEVVSRPSAK